MAKLDAGKPDKVIIGASPPEIWIRTGNNYTLAAVYPQMPRIVEQSEMVERIELAFSKGYTFVCVFDPLVTTGALH